MKTLTILCLFVVSTLNAQIWLNSPLDNPTAKGTFPDYRSFTVHGGQDIHEPPTNGVAALVKPVRSGTIFVQNMLDASLNGYNFLTWDFIGATTWVYRYIHVQDNLLVPDNVTGQNATLWSQLNFLPNVNVDDFLLTNSYFNRLHRWFFDWQDHVHLEVSAGGPKIDPLFQYDNNTPTFFYDDSIPPTCECTAYAVYTGPNNQSNEYYSSSEIPGDTPIDIIVYAHDRAASGYDQKVAPNEISYAVTTTSSQPSFGQWIDFADFAENTISSSDLDFIYARDNNPDASIPGCSWPVNTVHSGNDDDQVDKMWYIITNSDGNFNYNNNAHWQTPTVSGQPLLRYVWIRLIDRKGNTTIYNNQVTIVGNPTGIKDPPPAPTNLKITNKNAIGQNPNLTWNGSSEALYYNIYRRASFVSTWYKVGSTGGISYQDTQVEILPQSDPDAVNFLYQVKAENTAGESGASNTASVWGFGPFKINADSTVAQSAAVKFYRENFNIHLGIANNSNHLKITRVRISGFADRLFQRVEPNSVLRPICRFQKGPNGLVEAVILDYTEPSFESGILFTKVFPVEHESVELSNLQVEVYFDDDSFLAGSVTQSSKVPRLWIARFDSPETIEEQIPSGYTLSQNYPNPFNPTTNIRFALPAAGRVSLTVFNSLGQEVRRLVINQELQAGNHRVVWDATNDKGHRVASGTYIYELKANDFQDRKKLVLLK